MNSEYMPHNLYQSREAAAILDGFDPHYRSTLWYIFNRAATALYNHETKDLPEYRKGEQMGIAMSHADNLHYLTGTHDETWWMEAAYQHAERGDISVEKERSDSSETTGGEIPEEPCAPLSLNETLGKITNTEAMKMARLFKVPAKHIDGAVYVKGKDKWEQLPKGFAKAFAHLESIIYD
jgi:hypothetical protein